MSTENRNASLTSSEVAQPPQQLQPHPGVPATEPTAATPVPPTPPAETTSRKAFVTTIVSILLSPLSVALGFYLNHILQKPQLRVHEVDQSYYSASHSLPDQIVRDLAALPLLSAQIRDVITRTELAKGEIACVDWLDGKPWRDRCFETVLTAARGVDSAILAASATRLPKGLEGTVPSPAEFRSFRAALKPLIDWMATASADGQDTRTGGYCLNANIVNSGDFDGVVLKSAKIAFNKGEFTINADKYTVVKAHGYEQVEFCADTVPDTEQGALDAWTSSVKAHEETPFKVVLNTGDGATLTASTHLWK